MSNNQSLLMRMCTENVYNDNIFHLLGLRTTATPRQIRRRREDFDSAMALSNDSWKNEFRHLMGNRPTPTAEEVSEAFTKIEDPEQRIIAEFFWMWPLDDDDQALNELFQGRKSAAIKIWEQESFGYGKKRSIAQHNLAVCYQFYAIDAELQALDNDGYMPDDFRNTMLSYWEKAFDYWEGLADNDDFWELYEARMREFDDPRLTGGFIRRFRAEFPVAFDNINAQLAARYAKASRFDDAKRHVDYMSRTMSGLDDVQENMNIIFTPMEQRVKMLIDGYDEKVKTNPKQGLEYAIKLLDDTEEIRRIAEGMLKDGQRIRTGIFAAIASACNRYQVQYGNKTEDWQGCLELLNLLKKLACTPESKKVVDGNIETVKGNIKFDKEHNTCWICQERKADCKYGMKMYGEVRKQWGQIHWRHGEIDVPVCSQCKQNKESADGRRATAFWIVAIIAFIIGCCISPQAFILWGVAAMIVGFIAGACAGGDGGFESHCKEHPAIKEMLSKGWKFGDHPPTN